jgi:carbamate kinase
LQQDALEDQEKRPLDVLGAESQGQIGYELQRELRSTLKNPTATVLTTTLVDPNDPAFDEPKKPVGPYYSPEENQQVPFTTKEVQTNTGERRYRRVVPSPEPQRIVESEQIQALWESGATVVCGGGGGVPVIQQNGGFEGVEAVIDKDKGTQVLANGIGADILLLLTDVDGVYQDFGTPDQTMLKTVTTNKLERLLGDGEFGEGSMRPKVEAAKRFVANGGSRAVITSLAQAQQAQAGNAGTEIVA